MFCHGKRKTECTVIVLLDMVVVADITVLTRHTFCLQSREMSRYQGPKLKNEWKLEVEFFEKPSDCQDLLTNEV